MMDRINLLVAGINVLVKLMPPPKRPKFDYSDAPIFPGELPGTASISIWPVEAIQPAISYPKLSMPDEVEESPQSNRKVVATSCIACSQSHITGIAGALDESLRFARDGGVTDPEALRRIDAAEREIVTMERIDLSPEAILNSPEKDQEMARYFLPKIRVLRQDIGQIKDVPSLEKAAAEASVLSQEFRLKRMQSAGTDLNPIYQLAMKVQAGEMTIEEARIQARQYLPQES